MRVRQPVIVVKARILSSLDFFKNQGAFMQSSGSGTAPGQRFTLSLEATAFNSGQLIEPEAPQIAFAGRSNVGKSSLINALAGRKGLAKVSATPGKTRSINYYRINAGPAFLVDLPGYGYAKCSKEERNKWAALLDLYFRRTPGLAGLALLLDARLAPQQADREMLAFALSLGLPVLPVLTKADKCSQKALSVCMRAWGALLDQDGIVATSAEKKRGLEELWLRVAALVGPCGPAA